MIVLLAMAGEAAAQEDSCAGRRSVTVPTVALPSSADEFEKLQRTIGKTPHGGAALMIYSLLVRERDPSLGEQLLVLSVDASRLTGTTETSRGDGLDASTRRLLAESDQHPHCVRSYVVGTSRAEGYAIDASKVAVQFLDSPRAAAQGAEDRADVSVCSTGGRNCRPMTMARDAQGFWRAYRFAGLALPCAAPADETSAR